MSAPGELLLQFVQESTPEPTTELDPSLSNKAWENLAGNAFEKGVIGVNQYRDLMNAINYAETHGRFFTAHSVFAANEAGFNTIIFSDAGMLPSGFESQESYATYDGYVLTSSKTMLAIKHLDPRWYGVLPDYLAQDKASLPAFVFTGPQVSALHGTAIEKPDIEVFNRLNTYAEEKFELMLQSYIYQYGLDDFIQPILGNENSSYLELPYGGRMYFYEQSGTHIGPNALPSAIYSDNPDKLLQYLTTLDGMQGNYLQAQSNQILLPEGARIKLDKSTQFVGVEYSPEELLAIRERIQELTKERETVYLRATLQASETELQATQQAVQTEVQAAKAKSSDLTLAAAGACILLLAGIAYLKYQRKREKFTKPEKVAGIDYDPESGIEKPIQISIGEQILIDGTPHTFSEALRISVTDKTQIGEKLEEAVLAYTKQKPDQVISRTGLTEEELQKEENTLTEQIQEKNKKMRDISLQINQIKASRLKLQPAELLEVEDKIKILMKQHHTLEAEKIAPQRSKDSIKKVKKTVTQVLAMNVLQLEEEKARQLLDYLQERALKETEK